MRRVFPSKSPTVGLICARATRIGFLNCSRHAPFGALTAPVNWVKSHSESWPYGHRCQALVYCHALAGWRFRCTTVGQELVMLAIKHILFPIDFSERCCAAVPFVDAIASRFGAKITLMSVAAPYWYTGSDPGVPMVI